MSLAATSSRVWSCATLEEGVAHISYEAAQLEKEERELELQIQAPLFFFHRVWDPKQFIRIIYTVNTDAFPFWIFVLTISQHNIQCMKVTRYFFRKGFKPMFSLAAAGGHGRGSWSCKGSTHRFDQRGGWFPILCTVTLKGFIYSCALLLSCILQSAPSEFWPGAHHRDSRWWHFKCGDPAGGTFAHCTRQKTGLLILISGMVLNYMLQVFIGSSMEICSYMV